MRLRRENRGASSRMTSSVYRPLCSFGSAFRGGRFSVPSEVIRSGGDCLRFALRNGLLPKTRAPRFVTLRDCSYFVLRIGLRPTTRAARFATDCVQPWLRERTECALRNNHCVTRNESSREDPVHAVLHRPCRISRLAQHHERVAHAPRSGNPTTKKRYPRFTDPSTRPTGWTLREVGGDAQRCEVRSTSRRTDTATITRREALRNTKCSRREALRGMKCE